MGTLVINPGAYDTAYTPSAGWSIVSGVWRYGWDGASGTGSGSVGNIITQAGYNVLPTPDYNPGTLVDDTTVFKVASLKLNIDAQLGVGVSDNNCGVVLIDSSRNGLRVLLQGDDLAYTATGYTQLRIAPMAAGVQGTTAFNLVIPVITTATVDFEVTYNPFTKNVVVYINGVLTTVYNWSAAIANVRIGASIYHSAGAINFINTAVSSFDTIPHLKASYDYDGGFKTDFTVALGSITAAVGDTILLTVEYRDSYVGVAPLPVWNSQTFTEILTVIDPYVFIRRFKLTVTTAGTSTILMPTDPVDTFVISEAQALIYGAVASITGVVEQVILTSTTYAAPSLTLASLAINDIGLNILALSGYDKDFNNVSTTVYTPDANTRIVKATIASDPNMPQVGNIYAAEAYGTGNKVASWTGGAPLPQGYGTQNLYGNTGLVLKAATAADTTPDAFTFTSVTGSTPSATVTSAGATIAGINAASAITITGGTYAINGGTYVSTAGTVIAGDIVTVRVTASASYSTDVTATVTIGGVAGTFTATTRAVDTTPTAFTFTAQTSAALSTPYYSTPYTVAGVDAATDVAVTVANGYYAIDPGTGTFGSFVNTAGVVRLGYRVQVRVTSSASTDTNVTGTLTIGGVSGTFDVSTGAADTVPDAFTFTAVTGANPSTATDSNPIAVAGVTAATDVAITVTNGQYAIDPGTGTYGAFTSSAGVVRLGYNVKARATSSASFNTAVVTAVTIGTVASNFSVTTRAVDVTPSAFTFTDVTGVATGSVQTSNAITVAGVDAGNNIAISVSGGTYSINGGAYTASAGTVVLGDTVTVRVTASNAAATAVNATVTIGGVQDTYTATTATPALTAVGSGTVRAGATSVTVSTTGFSNITGLTVGGVACTALAGSGNSYTVTIPDLVDGAAFPVITGVSNGVGTLTAVATNGTATASLSIPFGVHTTQGSQVLTSVPSTGIGYIGYNTYATGAAIGDQVYFDLPATLAAASGQTVAANGVDVDGRIFSDYSGIQSIWLRKAATGTVVLLTTTTPSVTDTTPAAFTFTAVTSVTPSAVQTSNSITVTGINAASAISISGGTYSINGGAYTASAGTVSLNDTVTVRVTASSSYSTAASATLTIGGVTGTFTATTRAVDVTPTAMTFTSVSGATASSVVTSNAAAVAGIDAGQAIAISIVGGQYAVDPGTGTYGAYTSSATTVQLGYNVKIQVTASGSSNTAVTATLTVGGVASAFVVSTGTVSDTTPDAFSFTAVTAVDPTTVQTSNAITVAGVTAATDVPISVTGGQYAIDPGTGTYGAYTSVSGVVRLGYNVKAQVTASSSYSTGATASVTIGGVSSNFTATTRAADTTPNAFTFTAVSGAEISTATDSNAIVVAGTDAGQNSVVTITGGTYAIDTGSGFGAFTALSSNIQLGQSIKVRLNSSSSYSAATTATLTIGGVSSVFTVNTRAVDLVPTAFTFASISSAALNSVQTSAPMTVAGVDAGQDVVITVANGTYAIDPGTGTYGSYTASAGVVRLGYNVRVQATASSSSNTTVTSTLTIGGVAGTFAVSTGVAADTTPDAFSFTAVSNANISTNYDSSIVTVAGVTAATNVAVSVTGGTYAIDTGSGFGAFTSSAGNIQLGQSIKVRVGTSGTYANANTATLNIGGVTADYVVTTRAADTTPTAFTFTGVTGATVSQAYVSNAITVAGVDVAVDVPISVVGGTYSVDPGTGTYGAPTASAGVVRSGYNVKTQLTASSLGNTVVTSTVTIGGVAGVYSVNTGVVDTTPNAFSFIAATNSEVSTVNESSVVTVAGVDAGQDVAVTITGGSYAINTGSGYSAFTTNPGVIRLGQLIKVRLTTGSAYSATTTATLNIGGVTADYAVTTRAADVTPNSFSFTAVTGATPSTAVDSGIITVAGVDAGQDLVITVAGGSYAINNGSGFGAFTTNPGTVRLGYQVKTRVTSSINFSASTYSTVTIAGISANFTVNTRAADTTPTTFAFTQILSAAPSALYESNAITVAGVDAGIDIPISITGGDYLVNDGSGWGSAVNTAGNVRLGYLVKVQVTSSSSVPATVTAAVTIGGVSASYAVSTSNLDVTPDAFAFTDVIDAPTSTPFFSEVVAITGFDIDQTIPISVTGGQYRVTRGGLDGPWMFTASTISLGDSVSVYGQSGSGFGEVTAVTLTVGGVAGTFNITTRAADTSPRAFAFTTLTGALVSTDYESNAIVVTSVDAGVDIPIYVINGSYAIANGTTFGAFTSNDGVIRGGQAVKVRVTSSDLESTDAAATLCIGDIMGTFTVTTRATVSNVDDIPDPFTFTSVTATSLNTLYTSNEISVTDITDGVSIPITVTGASYYIDAGTGYGPQIVGSSTVKLGYKVKLLARSSAFFSTVAVASVNIGGVVETYTVTTRAPKIAPAAIALPRVTSAKVRTLYYSVAALISGIEVGATATLSTSGGLEYSINRGAGYEAWTTASTAVKSKDLVKTRLLSSTVARGTKVGRLIIANSVNTFSIINK